MMITSAVQNEGKSYISAEFAKSLAMGGRRVLLIDADMRNATQHKLFSTGNRMGLSSIIASGLEWRSFLTKTDLENLFLITAGKTPPNPTELLASGQMNTMLQQMRESFDYIIIDVPPIIPVSDAVALSSQVDGVLLVTRSGKTPKQFVIKAKQELDMANAPLIGAVLNDVVMQGKDYNYYH